MEILPELRRGLTQLQHALAPTEFLPAQADRVFHLSASAYIGEVLLPQAIARIRALAPQIQLNVRSADATLAEALEAGRVDLAIGAFGRTSDVFARESLFEERLVWVLRNDHPAARTPISAKSLEKLPLVLLAPATRPPTERNSRLIEPLVVWDELSSEQTPLGRGARQRIRVVVDNTQTALAIVASSDMAALVPRRLAASRAQALGLMLVELEGEPRAPTAIETVWRADQTSHPALSWLRGILREAAKDT